MASRSPKHYFLASPTTQKQMGYTMTHININYIQINYNNLSIMLSALKVCAKEYELKYLHLSKENIENYTQ